MPDHWQLTTLGEAAEVNPKELPLPEDAPFVPMDAVKAGQRWVQYTEPRGKRSGARARARDVLFARITPCLENGKTAQVQPAIKRCGGSTEFIVLRGSDRLDTDFLYFWATDRSVRKAAASLMTGSTGRQRLSAKDLAAMSLALPPVREQRRIVDLIESVDSYIASLQTQVDATRAARSAVLWELLSSPGNDWQETTLGGVTALVKRGRAPAYANEGLLVLNQKCIRSGNKIDYSVARRTDVGERPVPEWAIVRDGDVLVNSTGTGTAGRAALVASPPEPMTVDSHITIVRSLPDRVVPEFIGARLSAIAAELEGLASGSTNQIELSRQALADLPLRLPPLGDQQRIVDLVGAFDQQIAALESQIAATRIFRGGVLSELLSGERLLDASYDVAVSL